jgi:phospholipase C
MSKKLLSALFAMALAGCAGNHTSEAVPPINEGASQTTARHNLGSPIQHVIIVVQENRTVDNLFQGLPGANTQSWGLNSKNQQVTLHSVPLTAHYDLSHAHSAFLGDYDNGSMNGFDTDKVTCAKSTCPPQATAAYGYVPRSEAQPDFDLAEQFAFGDEMFETNQGPSFPAHQYLVSGTSSINNSSEFSAAENPIEPNGVQRGGGCDSPSGTTVATINVVTGQSGTPTYPCFNRTSLITEMDAAGVTWRYYQAGTGYGYWHAIDALQPIWSNTTEYSSHVITTPSQFLTDVKNGTLEQVTWVTPTALASDHPGSTNGTGPSWVASIVNTVAASPFWSSTAIIVTWDDWGGWYDHVAPKIRNSYELGFRVPLLVISPYVKSAGYVSHVSYEFGSILKFTEEQFNLAPLGTTDTTANDFSDFFNFTQARRKFKKIDAPFDARYFISHPTPNVMPDDD